MPILLQNVRYAFRQLRKSPSFAITAILTLALGVGANVVVFSVLNTLILRPLNVPHPENLYNIARQPLGLTPNRIRFSGLPRPQYHFQRNRRLRS